MVGMGGPKKPISTAAGLVTSHSGVCVYVCSVMVAISDCTRKVMSNVSFHHPILFAPFSRIIVSYRYKQT